MNMDLFCFVNLSIEFLIKAKESSKFSEILKTLHFSQIQIQQYIIPLYIQNMAILQARSQVMDLPSVSVFHFLAILAGLFRVKSIFLT